MKFQQTSLQKIEFGDQPEDIYYCLIDLRVSPNGVNIQKIRLTDPRNIDQQFRKHGCLMMFDETEITVLINRGEVQSDQLHRSLFDLALKENIIQAD
ncbi:MAG: hypothetical protein JJU37_02120 [Balneolaceae bacterium]|nr:hypothetical protein [Balneolaceae bacterium]